MSDPLREALANLAELLDGMKLHDDTGHPRDEGYMDAWSQVSAWLADREALAIEPEYEYRAVVLQWASPWDTRKRAVRERTSIRKTLRLDRQTVPLGHIERRAKAGKPERVP